MTNVAIIGAGAIGLGMTAFLASKGNNVQLFSRSLPKSVAVHEVIAEGVLNWQGKVPASSCLETIVSNAEVIFLCVPGNGHKTAIDALAPHLRAGQTVIISAQYSLSALYLSKRLKNFEISEVSIVALATTMVTGRRTSQNSVLIRTIRDRYGFAAYSSKNSNELSAFMRSLSGKDLQHVGMADIVFGNPNPIAHAPNALCNLTRIETSEDWSNYGMMTETVCSLIEQLDAERCSVARSFGVEPVTFAQHLHNSFGTPVGTIFEMRTHIAQTRGALQGPISLASRYITEDVPFGLVPVSFLGDLSDAEAKLHKSFVTIFSTACHRDFVDENDLLPALGIGNASKGRLQKMLQHGWLN